MCDLRRARCRRLAASARARVAAEAPQSPTASTLPSPSQCFLLYLGTTFMDQLKPQQAAGLYDPRFEHDACGVAMIARLDNEPSHEVVVKALTALDNLEHRGAEG